MKYDDELIINKLYYKLFQKISAQCIGAGYNGIADGVAWGGALPWEVASLAAPFPLIREAPCAGERLVGLTLATLGASNCRGFAVRSVSPIAPSGLAVTSENVFDGAVVVQGKLPFLSTASLEGILPSVGSGLISYGCGNGDIAILSEEVGPAGLAPGYGAYGPYDLGLGGPGLGLTPGLAAAPAALGLGLGTAALGAPPVYGGCSNFIN